MMRKRRVAVLLSGRGTNMLALAEAARAPDYPGEIVLALSNRAAAPGLEAARAMGIPAEALPGKPFADREAYDSALTAILETHDVEAIALAGFMRILSPQFVRRWAGRMVNIHPSLLPLYPGLDTHARALAAGDAEAGCTVHLVTEELDAGPVLGQARVAVQPGDTAETLAARVLIAEHRLYPQALAAFLRGLD
ncbi:phosphoribosylglycinamide formyltransferase [Sandaracinobacter neustonicus]|uniref:Phosphoribosylglycinamide formyltransferase n=1 Tax=Sandaracinobacter neustonicus TaxID=1715348 RepID=A0A501XDC8_9SPHN|nr:phosphoribosylglycinamide formyltransferase [Sandaracinobacter neustonicus]TPE58581.1 phosphoribosylglycinamide formyltransferase [Sandaracinobacter neustonicus]